jgi:hypothetical protein
MTKRRREAPSVEAELSDAELALLWGEPMPMETVAEKWETFVLQAWRPGRIMHDESRSPRDLWDLLGRQVLSIWVQERPGTRPPMWWRFEAPEIAREPWMPIADSGGGAPHVPADQLSYLRRHGLLTPAEQSALALIEATRCSPP